MVDFLTCEPLNVGFGAIVEHCKDLIRLSFFGLLTDRVFEYIGRYAKKLEMLSMAFSGGDNVIPLDVFFLCEFQSMQVARSEDAQVEC
ncbi:hypothetical protein V6N13_012915 [Hibiscus sabdariffa]